MYHSLEFIDYFTVDGCLEHSSKHCDGVSCLLYSSCCGKFEVSTILEIGAVDKFMLIASSVLFKLPRDGIPASLPQRGASHPVFFANLLLDSYISVVDEQGPSWLLATAASRLSLTKKGCVLAHSMSVKPNHNALVLSLVITDATAASNYDSVISRLEPWS